MQHETHIRELVNYNYKDERRHFEETFNIDWQLDDIPKHVFTAEQKTHIFYHIEMLNRALDAT